MQTCKLITNLAILFIAALLQACSEPPSINFVPHDGAIVAFGDSLTVGVGASEDTNYPAILSEISYRRVVNAGVSGEVTEDGLVRLPAVLEEENPNLVILLEGGNDILRNKNQKQTKDNLASMITLIQSKGADVVLIGVPEKKLFSDVAPFYEELADEYNLVFIDEVLSELLKDNEYKSDPIHLNEIGYRKLAETIHEKLIEVEAL